MKRLNEEAPQIDALVRLSQDHAPMGVGVWYHVSWRGIDAWIAAGTSRKRSGWLPWYLRYPELRYTPLQLETAALEAVGDSGVTWAGSWEAITREPTPSELVYITDPANWPRPRRDSREWLLHCPTCHFGWVWPVDRREHERKHKRVAVELPEAFSFAGLPEYDPEAYERWKGNTRDVFNGYDRREHTLADRVEAATQYLRVQCCQHAFQSILNDGWARFRHFYPSFTAYVRSEFEHYAHEFSPDIAAALIAEYGPQVLSPEQYKAREAEYLRVHANRHMTDNEKDSAILAITERYLRQYMGEPEGGK